MEKLRQEANACGENAECLNNIIIKIEDDITSIPDEIYESSDAFPKKITKTKLTLDDCTKNVYKTFQVQATKIYNEITDCIVSKF